MLWPQMKLMQAGSVCRWATLLGITLLCVRPATGRPPYKHSLKKLYGARLNASLHQCTTCHLTQEEVEPANDFDPEAPPHNAFGERLRALGQDAGDESDILSRLKQIAEEDTDGDGIPNELEILAGRQPGRRASCPTAAELVAARTAQQERKIESSGYPWEPFLPVKRPAVPSGGGNQWLRTPVDAFIAAEHARLQLHPAPQAPANQLLRRVYLDLIGLPPTGQQMREFLADRSPNAYEKVVDRLLASPQYGQRWGRHWMDIWRYSDWAGWKDGGQIRDSQPHIWHWRDWIIESLNRDRPYDAMVRAMLAADEISPTDDDDLRATGFLARNYKMLSRETWMQETIEHTSKAFLGLTINCARCHDHMYDPISQEEYYQFRAVFEPYQVRADRLPYQADIKIDAIPRVFDADLSAATYLFIKGDERNPDKGKAVSAGIPRMLRGTFSVKQVELPAESYYPGIRPHVKAQLRQAASDEVSQARAALVEIEREWSSLTSKQDPSDATEPQRHTRQVTEQKRDLALHHLETVQSRYHALLARMAADEAKYVLAPSPPTQDLSRIAVQAERIAQLAATHESFLKSEIDLQNRIAQANKEANTADANVRASIQMLEQKRDEASTAFRSAQAVIDQPTDNYAPVTEVFPIHSSGRRTAFANWLTAPDNPLVARVAVNHMWNRHFGRGLVESMFDFGQNGKPPSHPALLDWLAAELMQPTGQAGNSSTSTPPWSMKHIHRLLVTSSIYRMQSYAEPEQLARDPENRFYICMPVRRMEAEVIRDSVLHLAGQLDLAMGGPDIDYELGFTVPRRSLYFRHAAEKEMTFLKTFDAASVTECYQRKSSIMPQQALAMVNSELTISQARQLARTWHQSGPDGSPTDITSLFEHLLSRRPTPQEVAACEQFLAERTQHPAEGETAQSNMDFNHPSPDAHIHARELLFHVLLNHHDFISIH